MKKSGIWILAAITLAFVAFTAGFFLGRNYDRSPVQLSAKPFPVSTGSTAGTTAPTQSTAAGRVNINTAEAEQLQTLPGIGPVLAQRIIDHRMTYGYFKAVEDIAKVEGIGQKRMEELKDYITV